MIYISGDTHGECDFKKVDTYFKKRYRTGDDYLIILGDAGLVWSELDCCISEYNFLGLTVLFIDGNHENFELLNRFPTVEFKGAKCHRLASNVYHIKRGEIITLNGKTFFCMGGATSIDKHLRTNRVSWWEEENISNDDVANAARNLKKVNYKVDFVLTHAAPSKMVKKMFGYSRDNNTDILQDLECQITYDHWYFGHYHVDKEDGKFRCFYNKILELPIMYTGNLKKDYPVLDVDSDGHLINRMTWRRISTTQSELPEWYYRRSGIYFSLKGVTDVAFRRSWTENHINKDDSVYLHYNGKLKHKANYEPYKETTFETEWDFRTWRCSAVDICFGLEKYSPHLNLNKLKAAINLNYDQYNNRSEMVAWKDPDIVVRPFPEVKTPHYVSRWGNERAHYQIVHDGKILSEIVKLEYAKIYVEVYIKRKLNRHPYKIREGSDHSDYLFLYELCGFGHAPIYIYEI